MPIKYSQKTQCDICGSKNLINLFPIKDIEGRYGEFSMLQCQECFSYYTSPYPTPETIHELYMQRESNNNFDNKSIFIIDFLKDFFAIKQLKNYLKHLDFKPISFLDFGTGNARYAVMASRLLPKAKITASDFAENPPERLSDPRYKNIKYVHTPELMNQNQKYDVILLRHVLEHAFRPADFIKQLMQKLNKNGAIFIEVPNIKNIYTISILRDYYGSYNPPYHLVHFDEKALKATLNKAGVDFKIWQKSMALSSNFLANICHKPLSPFFQLAGILCHPLQMAAGIIKGQRESLCAAVKHK